MEEIESKLQAEKAIKEKTNPVSEFIAMFKAPRMAYRIFIGVSLQMFQQLTGGKLFSPWRLLNTHLYFSQLLFLLRHHHLPICQHQQL